MVAPTVGFYIVRFVGSYMFPSSVNVVDTFPTGEGLSVQVVGDVVAGRRGRRPLRKNLTNALLSEQSESRNIKKEKAENPP